MQELRKLRPALFRSPCSSRGLRRCSVLGAGGVATRQLSSADFSPANGLSLRTAHG
jgi:hypothetical protein